MTGTEVEIKVISGMSNMLPNETINEVLHSKLAEVGTPKFNTEEHAFARELSKSIPPESLETGAYVYGLDSKAVAALKDTVLFEDILPPFPSNLRSCCPVRRMWAMFPGLRLLDKFLPRVGHWARPVIHGRS